MTTPPADSPPARVDRLLLAAVLVVALGTFAADLRLGLGSSAAPLYEVAVLLGIWSRGRRLAVATAAGVTGLIAIESLVSPDALDASFALNRSATLLAIWSTAFVVSVYKRVERASAERRREAQAYLDIAAVAIVALDPHGRVLRVNRRGATTVGRLPADLAGRDWFAEVVVPAQRDAARAAHARLLEDPPGAPVHHEYDVRGPGGEPRTIAWNSVVLRDARGAALAVLASGEDVTARRRTEETLRAQQTLARLGQMAAVVAHEVRGPLAGIRSALEVLRGRLPADPETDRVMRAVHERIDGIAEMTDDLLGFARPRRLRQVPVAVRTLLVEAAAQLEEPLRRAGGLHVEGGDARLLGDPTALRGVLSNVLLNAAQASPPGAGIRVEVAAGDGRCRVTVADRGAGIAAEWRDRVFEPFFTTRHRGTGLGLAVARRDVEAHGGDIAIECPPHGGTVVAITLPIGAVPGAGRARP